jgi:NAD(P)-dependent dehydrogenase (short-subunit alcohol dehydrogenase family)
MDSAIVIGVGPERGLGAALCRRFARLGMHVVVAGRTQASLDSVVASIRKSGGTATAKVADATQEADVVALFDSLPGPPVLAIYNAGNNFSGRIVDMDAAYFERCWRVCTFGGFLFGREAIRRMRADGGTLLFTGASASLRGRAGFGAFNAAKGALRNLAQAMAKEYAAEGIHVGHVIVDGPIAGDKIIHGLPAYAEKLGPDGMINIEGIVDGYEFLWRQPRQAWSFELDVRTSLEKW